MVGEVEKDRMFQVPFRCGDIVGAISKFVETELEDRPNGGGLIAPSEDALVEGVNFQSSIRFVRTETVDSKNHTQDEARKDPRRMGRVGRDVEVKV